MSAIFALVGSSSFAICSLSTPVLIDSIRSDWPPSSPRTVFSILPYMLSIIFSRLPTGISAPIVCCASVSRAGSIGGRLLVSNIFSTSAIA
jgi:hypothetical protein